MRFRSFRSLTKISLTLVVQLFMPAKYYAKATVADIRLVPNNSNRFWATSSFVSANSREYEIARSISWLHSELFEKNYLNFFYKKYQSFSQKNCQYI